MSGFIQMTFDDMFLQKEEKYVRRIQYEETKPRSKTFSGIARAMADQWGGDLDGKRQVVSVEKKNLKQISIFDLMGE